MRLIQIMEPASRTPEGEPNTCGFCGSVVTLEPSNPPGDAPCPSCGVLLWFGDSPPNVIDHLATRGAFVEADDNGQIVEICLVGDAYDDATVFRIAKVTGVHTLDIRETKISALGAACLRILMPNTLVISR